VTIGRSRLLADLLAGAALLLDALAILFLVVQARAGEVRLDTDTIGGYALGATFPVVGWIIATRRPGNAMGWIFIGVGLSQALDAFAGQYAYVGLVSAPGSLPAADVMAWMAVWVWAPGFVLLVTAAVLLFPDGRLPSARWRPVGWLAGVSLALLIIPIAILAWSARGPDLLGEGRVQGSNDVADVLVGLQFAGLILLAVASIASIAGLIVRFRRSVGVERAQLKWFVGAGIVEVASLVIAGFVSLPNDFLGLFVTAVVSMLLPIAATLAILRYRLYEIDRIVSRTIAYLVITGVLVVVYAGVILVLQGPLGAVTGGDTVAVALSTLVVAALFQPVRRRAQTMVDRRFDRARFDAERTVSAFSERLRDETDIATVTADLDGTVREALKPTALTLWLRG
jgi:hypothetical protein